jgi:NADPH:quinone reductase-like Zn-dependent oxidoreductase
VISLGSAVPPHASQILGVEFSGVVEEVGPEPGDDDPNASLLRDALQKWKAGDEVYGLGYGGAYAEYIAVYATHLLPRPSHLSFVQAASIPEVWLTGVCSLSDESRMTLMVLRQHTKHSS